MLPSLRTIVSWRFLTVLSLGLLTAQSSHAQDTIGGGFSSGVSVDADGVLRGLTQVDPTGRLAQQRAAEAIVNLGTDVATPSKLRKVSLTRLSRLIRQAISEGHGPDEAMKHLAGLTRIQYVFFYPKTQDIVVAGPAEAWYESAPGRFVGVETGQPVLELQDLIVALRTFPPFDRKQSHGVLLDRCDRRRLVPDATILEPNRQANTTKRPTVYCRWAARKPGPSSRFGGWCFGIDSLCSSTG